MELEVLKATPWNAWPSSQPPDNKFPLFPSLQEEDKPTLYVFNAVTQDTMPIMESISLLDKTVSDLRTLVTLRCGLPVSVYCLRTPRGLEMYDCNTLKDYQTDIGTAQYIWYQLPFGTRVLWYQIFQLFKRKWKSRIFIYNLLTLFTYSL